MSATSENDLSGLTPAATEGLKRPSWWTDEDEAVGNKFREWQGMDVGEYTDDGNPKDMARWARWYYFLKDDWQKLNCRSCEFLESGDGKTGECRGPEIACGNTRAIDACEQWSPHPAVSIQT